MNEIAGLESILDPKTPFDSQKVHLLDNLVQKMLHGNADERSAANQFLNLLKSNAESWRIAGIILQLSTSTDTRFFALSILDHCIATRWNILPEDQKAGVKQYISDMVIKTSTDESIQDSKYIITKVNKTLIQIVKQEWPHNWPTFIQDICSAARTNQNICENSLRILNLFSEEIFDYGKDQIVSRRVSLMMSTLNSQFADIYDLCMFVLKHYVDTPNFVKQSLVTVTLQCLAHFLKWIPHEYIFQTGLIEILIEYFWDPIHSRIECIKCLTEISSLKNIDSAGVEKIGNSLWVLLVGKINNLSNTTMEYDVKCHSSSKSFWESFYLHLSICLTTLLQNHREDICEVYPKDQNPEYSVIIFIFEFLSLYYEVRLAFNAKPNSENSQPLSLDDSDGILNLNGSNEKKGIDDPRRYSKRLTHYYDIIDKVRHSIITKMPRPPEVCIHYDEETGKVDLDYQVDTDELTLYNIMRDTLIYLTNLGPSETEAVMTEITESLIQKASNKSQEVWNPTGLSRLCWAIGSISGAMPFNQELNFLLFITKQLLWLCEHKRGKENKAMIASLIMYIYGQYPRFLQLYNVLLEGVISKLMEFLEESFPGVQDMAAETFLKIAQKCGVSLVTPHFPATEPYIQTLIPLLKNIYTILPATRQQLMICQAAGHILSEVPDLESKQKYIAMFLQPFNETWRKIVRCLSEPDISESFYDIPTTKELTEILRVNERIAYTTGTAYSSQFMSMYQEILLIYRLYSTKIVKEVASHGTVILSHIHIKTLRNVKRATLLLVEAFVNSASSSNASDKKKKNFREDLDLHNGVRQEIVQFIVPPLLDPVLRDYQSSVCQARDHEVLSLLTTLILKLDTHMMPELPRIFDLIFDCTLDMIKTDFHSFPDHRTRFYEFLDAVNDKCFNALFALNNNQLCYFIESLVWAFKHEQPTIADQGLKITLSLIRNIFSADRQIILVFFRLFFWNIFQEIFSVLTDTLHKSGFQLQTMILMHLVQLVELGVLNEPEINITKPEVMQRLADMLQQTFANLNRKQIETFVISLFNDSGQPKVFSQRLRDFLIQLKEFSGSDELFEDERQEALRKSEELRLKRESQVPGLAPQYIPAKNTRIEDFDI